MTRADFTFTIQLFCQLFDASISSTHRTTEHNRRVGGAANSQHLGWKAADVVLDDWGRKHEAIGWLEKVGFFVLDEVASANHLHVDDRYSAV